MATSRAVLKSYFQTSDVPTETQFSELIDAYSHIDEGNVQNAVRNGADPSNNALVDSGPALQSTIDNAINNGEPAYIPPGTYYVGAQLNIPVLGKTPLHIFGAGRGKTIIRPMDSKATGTALMGITGGSGNSNILQFGVIRDMQLLNLAPNNNQGTYALDLSNVEHSLFSNLRVSQGTIAAMRIGYSYTCTFNTILAQSAGKFGILCNDTVFNNMTFDNVMCLLNGEAGFYSVGGHGINFSGCGFEDNVYFGTVLNRVRGAVFSGCYWEGNAHTDYTFTQRDGASLTPNWSTRSEIALLGANSAPTTSMPISCGRENPCTGIKFSGCEWSPGGGDATSFLAAGGTDGLELGTIGFGANYIANPENYALVEMYGDDNMAMGVQINDRPSPIDNNSRKVRFQQTPTAATGTAGDWRLAEHRYNWVRSKGFEIDISTFVPFGGGGTYTDTTKTYRQTLPIYSIQYDGGTTSQYFGTTLPTADYPELHGKRCILEMGFYPLADDSFSATTYAAGLQTWVQGADGLVESPATIQDKHPEDVETNVSITNASTTCTVTSNAGLTVGRPVCIAGGAGSGHDLTTFIAGISGTTITLDDAAGDTLSGIQFFQPAMQVKTSIFQFPTDLSAFGVRARVIGYESAVNGRRSLLVYATIREVGSHPLY